jgi:hypothetical protein
MQGIGNDIISFGGNNLSQISINNNLILKHPADRYRDSGTEEQVDTSVELNMGQMKKELERRNSQFQLKQSMMSSYMGLSPNKKAQVKYNPPRT